MTRRRRSAVALVVTLGIVVALVAWWRPIGGAPGEPVALKPAVGVAAAPRVEMPSQGQRRAARLPVGSSEAPPPETRELWAQRLERAQHTLSSYLAGARYPPESRPLSEHPDQVHPHYVGPLSLPLARKDGKLTNAKVTLRQDRMYLVGDERATLSIRCDDGDGPATCAVSSAGVIVPPDVKGASDHPPTPITFREGEGGALVAVFQPSTQGFGGYRGPLRIELALTVNGETGGASFDIFYTPAAPATFTGRVSEALRNGSLELDVEIVVDEPGRYVITARADDAEGKSFAYLSENEEFPAGKQEVRLRLFGKLIRDESARAPFHLRDLEGYRLLEDTYPDRNLMSGRDGVIYTTKTYTLRDFSDAEWESEEKARHVKEFAKDVDEAKQHAEGG